MKRTKSETRANYLLMMVDMYEGKGFHLGDIINKYNVNANIGNLLIKSGYIKKSYPRGYYAWVSSYPVMDYVETLLKKPTPVKPTQAVSEFGKSLTEAYPKKHGQITTLNWLSVDTAAPMEQREQAAIEILGSIMRDNQHITYDLNRIERKETITDLLAR